MACSRTQNKVEDEIPTGPNWLELPRDVTQNILLRLDVIEIVTSACLVCPLWWNICKEPSMWRIIDMRTIVMKNHYTSHYDMAKIFKYAIDRSCGQVEDINVEDNNIDLFGSDQLLIYIADCASHLKRLRLAKGIKVSDYQLSEVAKNLPLLEELEISIYKLSWDTLEVIAQCCPLLKSFKFSCLSNFPLKEEVFANSKMSRLRHLKGSGLWLTDDSLLTIFEGCPRLESLDLEECFDYALSEWLVKRCHEQMKDFLPPSKNFLEEVEEEEDYYDYGYHSPASWEYDSD